MRNREMKPCQLQSVRTTAGISRAELARRAKMQAGVVAWVETGRFIPYDSQLLKLAAALDWQGDPHELLEEVGEDA